MYDRETGSLWSQINGEAIAGDEKGKSLDQIPSRVMTWGEWRRLHPETLVLEKPAATPNEYARYASDPEKMGIFGTKSADKRLGGKEWVMGISRGTSSIAFPHENLRKAGVAWARVGGEHVVAAWNESGRSSVAFLARAFGKELDFSRAGEDPARARDATTGSTWNLLRGEAVEGPLKGARLEQIAATDAYWFAWSSFYPRTEVWKPAKTTS